MKKKKSILKIIACSLVLSLSLTMLQPLAVFAEQNISSSETTLEKWVPSEEDMRLPNTKGDLTLEQLETAKLLPEDTPEIVSQESIEENGHVNRLWEQEEDLNTVVFQNRDGTKTAYHYSDPVKYTDKNGKVKDKKNKLSETTNGEYTNAENDINAYFPKKIHKNKGVELKFGKYVFEMSPNINGSSGASRQTGHDKDSNPTEYVEYPEVFADDISLRYTPTFGGYKEDIILAKNTGINRFEFKLTTNGLSLVQASTGNYYLAEPLTGEYVTALGNVIVYDNTGVESEGYNHYYEVTTISQDEQYLITVIVDEHYLESKDTVYPVYVDPTLTVMPQGDVEDAVLYSNDSETAYSGLIKIGYDAAYGTGRGLYDFPFFNFTNDFILMYGNQIKSAELNLYAQIQGSDRDNAKNLSLYEFHSDWSPSTVKWSNTDPDNYDTLVSSKSVTTGWTAFNILPVIEKFKSDSDYAMAFKGLLLKANSETYTTWKKFVSSSGTTSRRPYITIAYNDSPTACSQVVSGATYYLKNYNGDYLDVYNGNTSDNTRLLTYAFHGDVNQQFKITNVFGGEYEIAPQHTTGKVLSVNSSGQVIIEEDCNLSRQRWYIYYKNGDYHIVNKAYNSGVMAPTYDTEYVSINSEYEYCCWELTPSISSPDTMLDRATQDALIMLKELYFQATYALQRGEIDLAQCEKTHELIDIQMDLVRADYIITGDNPQSDYAYAVLGGTRTSSASWPFTHDLELNSDNPQSGLAVIVIQRVMTLYGYYEGEYGYFDEDTNQAVFDWKGISANEGKVDRYVYHDIFSSATLSERTVAKVNALKVFNARHTAVQNACAKFLAADIEVTITNSVGYRGRGDLVSNRDTTSYIWEVKPNKAENYGTNGKGTKQLENYIFQASRKGAQVKKGNNTYPLPLVAGYTIPEFAFRDPNDPNGTMIQVSPSPYPASPQSGLILYKKLGLDETPKNPVMNPSEIIISEYNFGFAPSTSVLSGVVIAGAATLIVFGTIVCIFLIPKTGGASAALIIPLEQAAAKVIEKGIAA